MSSVVRFLVLFLIGRCAETTSQINDDSVLIQNSLQAAKKHNLSYDFRAQVVEGGDEGQEARQTEANIRTELAYKIEKISVISEQVIAQNGREYCSRLFKYLDADNNILDLRCVNSYKPKGQLAVLGDQPVIDVDGFCYAKDHKVQNKLHQNNYGHQQVPDGAHLETQDCLCHGQSGCNAAKSYYGCKWSHTKTPAGCGPGAEDGKTKCDVCGGTWVGGGYPEGSVRHEQVRCKDYWNYAQFLADNDLQLDTYKSCCTGALDFAGVCSHGISGEANEEVQMTVLDDSETGE